MKKCPACAEEIQDEAIKCRYCGEMLSSYTKKACQYCGTENTLDAFRCKNDKCAKIISSSKEMGRDFVDQSVKSKKPAWTRGQMLFAVLIVVFLIAVSRTHDQEERTTAPIDSKTGLTERDEQSIKVAASVCIEMAYPKTKVLPYTTSINKNTSKPDVYMVSGKIEKENVYGATIRTLYGADVSKNDKGTWDAFNCSVTKGHIEGNQFYFD